MAPFAQEARGGFANSATGARDEDGLWCGGHGLLHSWWTRASVDEREYAMTGAAGVIYIL
jgi:hypothetical protein